MGVCKAREKIGEGRWERWEMGERLERERSGMGRQRGRKRVEERWVRHTTRCC